METRKLLDINMHAFYEGLNKKEMDMLEYLLQNVFSTLKKRHWEGVEVASYRKFMSTKS